MRYWRWHASSVARRAGAAAAADDKRGHGSPMGTTSGVLTGAHHDGCSSSVPSANLKDATSRRSSSDAASARNGKADVKKGEQVSPETDQQRQSQITDRWAVAREMVTTTNPTTNSLADSAYSTGCNPTATTSTPTATVSKAQTNAQASPLIQKWQELENKARISPNRAVNCLASSESSAVKSHSVDKPSGGNSDNEWETFAECRSAMANSTTSSMSESEKSRTGSIVKIMTGAGGSAATAPPPSEENDALPSLGWRGAGKAVLGQRLLRGQGQMESFVARMEEERRRERRSELAEVAGYQTVSHFPYPGRIQSMMKLSSLRGRGASPAVLPKSRSEISSVREMFDRGYHSSNSRNRSMDAATNIQVQLPINGEVAQIQVQLPVDHQVSSIHLYPKREEVYASSISHSAADAPPRYQEIAPSLLRPADNLISAVPQYQQIVPLLPCSSGQLISNTPFPQYQHIAPPPPCPINRLTSTTSPLSQQIANPLPYPTDHFTSNASPQYQQFGPPLSYPTDHLTSNIFPQYQQIDHFNYATPVLSSIDHSAYNTSQCRETMPPHTNPFEYLAPNIPQYQEITPILPCPTDNLTFDTSQHQEIVPPFPCHNNTPRYQETAAPETSMHIQSGPNLPQPTMTIEDLQEGSGVTITDVSWRPWRVQRRPLDNEFLKSLPDKVEIRQLLKWKRVSTLLESNFRNKMNQMLLSFLHKQNNYKVVAVEDQNGESTSTSLVPIHNEPNQTTQEPHDWQHHEPFSQQSSQNAFDMKVMDDMRNDMAKIRKKINGLKGMIASCIEWQSNLRQYIKQDILEAIQQTASDPGNSGKNPAGKGICNICCQAQVDSLFYRCGHMCSCFNCAYQLQWNGGQCPVCRTLIVDVVRIVPNS